MLYYHLFFLTLLSFSIFFFNDTATTEIYTISLHDALPISWIGRDGKQLGTLGAPGNFEFFSLSPDDKRVAADTHDPDGYVSMWIVDARGANSRLNMERNFWALTPRWSPDGQQVAFAATIDVGDPNANLYRQS